jgi:hypothetical protein
MTTDTAHLLALMKKGDDVRPGQPGHCRRSVTRKAPGARVWAAWTAIWRTALARARGEEGSLGV